MHTLGRYAATVIHSTVSPIQRCEQARLASLGRVSTGPSEWTGRGAGTLRLPSVRTVARRAILAQVVRSVRQTPTRVGHSLGPRRLQTWQALRHALQRRGPGQWHRIATTLLGRRCLHRHGRRSMHRRLHHHQSAALGTNFPHLQRAALGKNPFWDHPLVLALAGPASTRPKTATSTAVRDCPIWASLIGATISSGGRGPIMRP